MMASEMMQEHYETLGVSESCSDDELTQAYRDLVKVWHPDRFAGDARLQAKAQEELKRINAAYETVCAARTANPPKVMYCGHCGQALRIPSQAMQVRCPSCGHEQSRDGQPRPTQSRAKSRTSDAHGSSQHRTAPFDSTYYSSASRQSAEDDHGDLSPNAFGGQRQVVLKSNPLALTGFILGLASIFIAEFPPIPILAVLCSTSGLTTFDPARHVRQWQGWWGLLLGIVYCLVALRIRSLS